MTKQIDLSGSAYPHPGQTVFAPGLTKRELFAAMAMQGFAADPSTSEVTVENVAASAVRWADALLKALEQQP